MALERRDRILRRENRSLPFFSVQMLVLLQNKIHEVFKGDKHARIEIVGGKVTVPFKRFLGYDCGLDGTLVVTPEQAVTIKRIYSMFLQ